MSIHRHKRSGRTPLPHRQDRCLPSPFVLGSAKFTTSSPCPLHSPPRAKGPDFFVPTLKSSSVVNPDAADKAVRPLRASDPPLTPLSCRLSLLRSAKFTTSSPCLPPFIATSEGAVPFALPTYHQRYCPTSPPGSAKIAFSSPHPSPLKCVTLTL